MSVLVFYSNKKRVWLALATTTALVSAGCTPTAHTPVPGPVTAIPPLPGRVAYDTGAATPRVNGEVGANAPPPKVAYSDGRGSFVSPVTPGVSNAAGGNVSLDFADTDIREAAAQILGNTLHVNYTIDPAVHGTATLRTVVPLSNAQLIPVLQSLLAQNGATLVQSGGVYRVLPVAAANGLAGGEGTAGGTMVPLRYAQAEDLAKALQPYAQNGARIIGVPASNAVVISGEPGQRDALVDLVRAFDIDELAGQSYALFPVQNGSAEDFADALKQAFRSQSGGTLINQVRVVAMKRVDAVLVIANSPRYLEDAKRAYGVIQRGQRQTMRTWHVYYLQNSTANDVAYVLQQAFTPGNVTAQPTQHGQSQNSSSGGIGMGSGGSSGGSSSGIGGIGSGSSSGSSGGSGGTSTGGLGSAFGGSSTGGSGGQGAPTTASAASTGSNPLLGGISNSGGGGGDTTNTMRIIPNPDNNAVLVYATGQEEDTVEAMLHKIDILPLQVRIDVIIAEVTLNDSLQYGTQFYLRHHSINAGLSNTSSGPATFASAATSILALPSTTLPSFVFNAAGKDGDLVIQALQGITTVKVLSSPDLLVLDNETAQLEVGNVVPYQTGSLTAAAGTGLATSTSVSYQQTGVLTKVTPRVNSGGLVTLDIAQEVSGVAPSSGTSDVSGSTINSPTFTERAVQSRVVVQDGQTVGLAGLITDQDSRGNTGLPWLKDVPVLGLLTGTQANTRTRTELLVLLTPHVLHDQRDARALTEDLREALPSAALVPYQLQKLPATGSADPETGVRKGLGLGP
jgi:general secretion pathway protein D